MNKFSIVLILLMLLVANYQIVSASSISDNRSLITDIFKTKNSLNTAKYEGKDSHHCTAVMITKDIGLTASHCKDGGFEEGYIGTIYPGESGLATNAGSAYISTFNPFTGLDIAILKTIIKVTIILII